MSATLTPTSIGTIKKSDHRQIRIELREFKGRHGLDIREWYLDDDWKPGKGCWVPASCIEEFMEAIAKGHIPIYEFAKKHGAET